MVEIKVWGAGAAGGHTGNAAKVAVSAGPGALEALAEVAVVAVAGIGRVAAVRKGLAQCLVGAGGTTPVAGGIEYLQRREPATT